MAPPGKYLPGGQLNPRYNAGSTAVDPGMHPGYQRTVQPKPTYFGQYGVTPKAPVKTPVASQGGRSNAHAAAAKAAKSKAAKNKGAGAGGGPPTTTTTIPPTPPVAPAQVSLNADYNPDQLNLSPVSEQVQTAAGKLQLPNALNYANSMASMQYGPQINAVAQRIKGLTAALPESIKALDAAFAGLDARRAQAVAANMQTSGQGVANLFGGAEGAAGIAANQSAQASATAANENSAIQTGNDANATREADWKTRIGLLNNMAINQGKTDLAGLQGQYGSAKKAYYDQGLKTRSDMISQAISNKGALNNQEITRKMAVGYLEQQGLHSEAMKLANEGTAFQVGAAPAEEALKLAQGKAGILATVTNTKLSVAAAKQALAKGAKDAAGPPTTVYGKGGALSQNLDGALQKIILPSTAVTGAVNPTTGKTTYNWTGGDPNALFANAMNKFKGIFRDEDPKKLRQYVANQINIALHGSGRPWVYKGSPNTGGKFVKAKKK